MTNQPGDSQKPGIQKPGNVEAVARTAAASLSPSGDAQAPAASEAPPRKLTAEEQMAQYEDDLKNADWGHQPC